MPEYVISMLAQAPIVGIFAWFVLRMNSTNLAVIEKLSENINELAKHVERLGVMMSNHVETRG